MHLLLQGFLTPLHPCIKTLRKGDPPLGGGLTNIKSDFIFDEVMFIERTLLRPWRQASRAFPVLLLTGPRQTGKTTLLKHLKSKNRSYISLDSLDTRIAARQDPAGFIQNLKLPVLIDEVQYAPELFPYIKITVDEVKKPGLFWLTGSQQFLMMKNVSESLAGRVALFELQGLSLAEEEKRPHTSPFIPTPDILKKRSQVSRYIPVQDIYKKIWRGSYPQVLVQKGKTWKLFYESYLTTYIERDVREYLKIGNIMSFRKFMLVMAARTGGKLNYRKISNDTGVSEPTVKSWIQVLEATGLIRLIYPYFTNITKRMLKTPKFYFMDTGLCCFLTGWLNPQVTGRGAMAGPLLETYAVSEIIKSHLHNGQSIRNFYYYTDKDQNEVDLLMERAGKLHPIEIKKSTSLQHIHFKGLSIVQKHPTTDTGCVLCFHKMVLPLRHKIYSCPISYI